ncbi:DUF4249 domain-containing protein [Chitinophaga horti]|uniref:DUF4249 domain-containing protein n=1 Tax=Chitinophaga horti TaxID=2920382 RepID=A0ABY6J5T3_9BACT|nr:DUF4249 domain-containing protein [Chitinophaga horti]UYQ95045.1 DUF4249 domain-containing protein [Chitinophaga horti]
MGNRLKHIVLFVFALALGYGCKDPYTPDITTRNLNYLVVEGQIINGQKETRIKLSRTAMMADSAYVRDENNAIVRIESDNNQTVETVKVGDGLYSAGILNLDVNQKYRVYIQTLDGKEYTSAFVSIYNNPPIDSVNWRWDASEGVKVFVNTHDPNNNTRYYRWEYEETWQHDVYFESSLKYLPQPPRLIDRPLNEALPLRCWQYENSSSIILHSTQRLANDVVKDKQVALVPNGSWKLGVKYTILVRQFAMDKQALDYWQMMKRNTESLGSIFDPQPSESRGNITCVTNPSEPVIGWISAGSVQEERIWIRRSEVPGWRYALTCEEYDISPNPDSLQFFFEGGMLTPISQDPLTGRVKAVAPYCADCSVRANPVRPSYWQ